MAIRALVCLGLAALASTVSAAPAKTKSFEIRVEGYRESCFGDPVLSVWEKGAWRPAERSLPGKGLYYLDGTFVGYGACDYVTCNKIEGPIGVGFFEYRKAGDRPPPAGSGTTSPTVPAFETVPLKGKIRVELAYFADDKCSVKRAFSKVLRR